MPICFLLEDLYWNSVVLQIKGLNSLLFFTTPGGLFRPHPWSFSIELQGAQTDDFLPECGPLGPRVSPGGKDH
jgi:hypothetical protein